MEDRIVFEISGEEYKKLRQFQKDHEGHLEEMPNLSRAQYTYTFTEDGFGLFKTVECVCGETLYLTGDYDMGLPTDMSKERPTEIPRKSNMEKIVKFLKGMEKRPGMYLGKSRENCWHDFYIFILGAQSLFEILGSEPASEELKEISRFGEMLTDISWKVEKDRRFERIKDEEAFDSFFKLLWKQLMFSEEDTEGGYIR